MTPVSPMMLLWPYILVCAALVVGYLFYLKKYSSDVFDRQQFLKNFAHFFEGELTEIPDHENSHHVEFQYRGHDFIFEDIALPGVKPGSEVHTGFLKIKTRRNMSLTFTERQKTKIRSNVQSLQEVSNSRWGTLEGQVRLPRELEEFYAYTNKPEWANRFVNDPRALKFFVRYKNRDSRGHPVLSLQIVEGTAVLEFHAEGGLTPSFLTLEQNVTAVEPYLQALIEFAEVLKNSDSEKTG